MFITSCSSTYHEHFFREHPELAPSYVLSGQIFQSDGEIESLPNQTSQSRLIWRLDAAKARIWIEMYTWTDAAKLVDPIIRAHIRWVDVRVILEWNVYGTPSINASVTKKLKNAGITVVYADNKRYTFTHAKFWIIDDAYFISTGNWTASFFTKNREYIYHNRDPGTRAFLEAVFLADAAHLGYRDISHIPPQMVVSPMNSRVKIEQLLLSTQKELLIYVQTLDDAHILSIIEQLSLEKKHITICTADNESNQARKWQYPYWSWKTIRKPYLHAKVIIVDHTTLFIGSHNLTTNAIENNREMGIILSHPNTMIHQIESDFTRDHCR